jgi:hypothetical protein
MQGAATQAMPLCIVEERQRRGCPPAAAPLGLRPAAKCKRYSLTGPKLLDRQGDSQSLPIPGVWQCAARRLQSRSGHSWSALISDPKLTRL